MIFEENKVKEAYFDRYGGVQSEIPQNLHQLHNKPK